MKAAKVFTPLRIRRPQKSPKTLLQNDLHKDALRRFGTWNAQTEIVRSKNAENVYLRRLSPLL